MEIKEVNTIDVRKYVDKNLFKYITEVPYKDDVQGGKRIYVIKNDDDIGMFGNNIGFRATVPEWHMLKKLLSCINSRPISDVLTDLVDVIDDILYLERNGFCIKSGREFDSDDVKD